MMHCCLQMCNELHSRLHHPMSCTCAHNQQNVLFMIEWTLHFSITSVTFSDQDHISSITKKWHNRTINNAKTVICWICGCRLFANLEKL